MKWFYMISHPFMTPTQPGDTPRVLPVQQYDTIVETNVPQQPVAVAAAAPDELDVDVHRLGHAMEICFFFSYFVFVVFILLLTIFM